MNDEDVPAPRSMAGRTVLVVGVGVASGEALVSTLRVKGARVLDAESAEDALHRLGCHAVDIVIADLEQPGLGGLELVEELRLRAGPPVVLVAERDRCDQVAELLDRGAADLVVKPESPYVIAARCSAVLRRSRRGHLEPRSLNAEALRVVDR